MNDSKIKYDVIVVGGGASGLMAAITAKRKNRNLKLAVLELHNKVGKKLLATGNGRCNLTNTSLDCNKYYGSFKPDYVLNQITAQKLINKFADLGLVCREEKNGLVYPYSKQASSVVEILLLECHRLGVEIFCSCQVNLIKKSSSDFFIRTNNANFQCRKVILCTGGKASPSCGGTGAGLDLLKNLGHTIVPVYPALCPVETENKLVKSLKGVRVSAKVSLLDSDNLVKSEVGELQFTENALSGICIFNLSSQIRSTENPRITVSFFSEYSYKEIYSMLTERKNLFYDNLIEDFFTGLLNKKIAYALLKESNIFPLTRKCSTLTLIEIEKLTNIINNWQFVCKKLTDFSRAQVMSGGVLGNEINPKTLESKIIKNLYICGEALDINGDCGGFNLHFAFASGIVAGENI